MGKTTAFFESVVHTSIRAAIATSTRWRKSVNNSHSRQGGSTDNIRTESLEKQSPVAWEKAELVLSEIEDVTARGEDAREHEADALAQEKFHRQQFEDFLLLLFYSSKNFNYI